MKKLCLFIVVIACVILSSCGGSHNKAIKTDMDSLSYALGVEAAVSAFRFDSTINVDLYVQGFKDFFDKTNTMTFEQARSYVGYYVAVGRAKRNDEASKKWFEEVVKKKKNVQNTVSGLYYVIEKEGQEPKVQINDTVSVIYTLRTPEGTILDASNPDKPYQFVPATGMTIRGFAEGVTLAGKGGKVTLFVPWDLAYGEFGTTNLGPKQSLQFDVEIVNVKPAK